MNAARRALAVALASLSVTALGAATAGSSSAVQVRHRHPWPAGNDVAMSPVGIGSVAARRIVVDDVTVSTPVSVEAYPTFKDLNAFLYRTVRDTDNAGFADLRQRQPGSTTWRGPLEIDAYGVPLGELTLGVTAYRTLDDEEEVPSFKQVPLTVKSGSRTVLTTRRSASTVTLTATATYYHADRDQWLGWPRKKLSFQTQLPSGSWSQFATAVTDPEGVARARGTADTPRTWRVVTPEGAVVWSSTSRTTRA